MSEYYKESPPDPAATAPAEKPTYWYDDLPAPAAGPMSAPAAPPTVAPAVETPPNVETPPASQGLLGPKNTSVAATPPGPIDLAGAQAMVPASVGGESGDSDMRASADRVNKIIAKFHKFGSKNMSSSKRTPRTVHQEAREEMHHALKKLKYSKPYNRKYYENHIKILEEIIART